MVQGTSFPPISQEKGAKNNHAMMNWQVADNQMNEN